MGDDQVGLVDLARPRPEDVGVEGAWAPAHACAPGRPPPRGRGSARAGARGVGGRELDDEVEVGPLARRAAHRLGLVERRDRRRRRPPAASPSTAAAQVGAAVTEVGAEADEGAPGDVGGVRAGRPSAGAAHPDPGRGDVEGERRAELAHRDLDRLETGVDDEQRAGQAAGQGLEQPVGAAADDVGRGLGQGAVVDRVGQVVALLGRRRCRPRPRCRARRAGPGPAPRAARRAPR